MSVHFIHFTRALEPRAFGWPRRLAFAVSVLCFLLSSTLPAMDWTATNYEDEGWTKAPAELGFGDGDEATVLPAGSTTYYFRRDFWVTSTWSYTDLTLGVKYDDGFVAYINGQEVVRANMPAGPVGYDTPALASHEGEGFESFDISWWLDDCHNGFNLLYLTLAVEVHQYTGDPNPADLSFDATLTAGAQPLISIGSDWGYSAAGSVPPPLAADPVTVIQRPLMHIPEIRKADEGFEIECMAPPGTTAWSAQISTATNGYGLTVNDVTVTHTWADAARYLLAVSIPSEVPAEIYDLSVWASGGVSDTAENAVKVVHDFKESYYFVHLTDSHIPEHFDGDNLATLEAIIDEINLIQPEFVLFTGDCVNRGQCEDQHEVLQRTMGRFEVPVYMVSGNHELYCWCGDDRERAYYRKYWGWSYLDPDSAYNMGFYTQNFFFDYGGTRYLGLETYKIHIYDPDPRACAQSLYGNESLLDEQIDWLEGQLSSQSSNVLFYHYDFGPEGEGRSITPVLNDHGNIPAAFYGHLHYNDVSSSGATPTLLIQTGAACPDNGGHYRLVRVAENGAGGQIVDYPVLTYSHLSIEFPGNPNDGSWHTVRAVITNTNDCAFESGLVKFKVPDDGKTHSVDGGDILQVVDVGAFLTYYVRAQIPAQGQLSLTLSRSADLDFDAEVDIDDLDILVDNWGAQPAAGDINGDGEVNAEDLGMMLSDWTGGEELFGEPSGRSFGGESWSPVFDRYPEVMEMLREAEALFSGDARRPPIHDDYYIHGNERLEQILLDLRSRERARSR